jgi:hypothetical protein
LCRHLFGYNLRFVRQVNVSRIAQMTGRTISVVLLATLVAGTLDLLSAFVFSGINGVAPTVVLRSVASGPFGDAMRNGGNAAAMTGLVVHFTIMSIMVGAFVLAAGRVSWLMAHPVLSGFVYGIALYLLMYWVVLPMRWPMAFPKTALWPVANALFSHIVCVGLPIALIVARRHKGARDSGLPI